MNKSEELHTQARGKAAEARGIVDTATAEKRDLTSAELAKVTDLVASAKGLRAAGEAAGDSEQMMEKLRNLDGPVKPAGDPRRGSWSKAVLAATQTGGHGFKNLSSNGSVLVPTSFSPAVVEEGKPPATVTGLIPVQQLTGTDRFAYLREVTRTNNASTVAAGQIKPTSVYEIERVEDRTRVIAHLSEPFSRQLLGDANSLIQYIDGNLRYGLETAVENQVLNGDADTSGVLDDLTGILNTEHVVSQEFDVDALTSVRKAITTQQVVGNKPDAIVLNPSDWETFELLTSDLGVPVLGANIPVDVAAKRLWGLPIVLANALPAGTGLLGDFTGSARLFVNEQVQIDWSAAAKSFIAELCGLETVIV